MMFGLTSLLAAPSSPLPAPPMNEFGGWMLSLMCLIGTVAFLLWAYNQGKEAFGRKPPIDDDLDDLREQLQGLAPADAVNTLIGHLANAATKDDVQKVRDELKGYVDQEQLDRRMAEVKELLARTERDLTQQIKDLRGYLHDDVHEFRNMAQATWANAEIQREGLHSRVNVIAEAVSEIRGWMRGKFRGEEQRS
jgi:hypothetical protein